VLRINHYIYSDRLLDERLERYPQFHHGEMDYAYTDIEAVHVAEGRLNPACCCKKLGALRRPIAVTEAHLGSTREEQLRWLKKSGMPRQGGVDVRAVTAWSLLGTYDWNCLVTRINGHYESGVFDLRSPQPRPTAIAQMLQVSRLDESRTILSSMYLRWWRRPERLFYPPVSCCPNNSQLK